MMESRYKKSGRYIKRLDHQDEITFEAIIEQLFNTSLQKEMRKEK